MRFRIYYNLWFSKEKTLARNIRQITGFGPKEVFLYKLALRHSSMVRSKKRSARECNERLEFLGDAILDSVVSEYLFKIYPLENEGFLTEMRSKIVNRDSLNQMCRELRIDTLIQFQQNRKNQVHKSMYGDALEAFIGAIYLDRGYSKCKVFILKKIIDNLIDLKEIENRIVNYKSKLLEYVQQEKLDPLSYELVEEKDHGHTKEFRVKVLIGEEVYGFGNGNKKKIAEQKASEEALIKLNQLKTTEISIPATNVAGSNGSSLH